MKKGCRIFSFMSGGIPGPSPSIMISHSRSVSCTLTHTWPRAGTDSMAFKMTLVSMSFAASSLVATDCSSLALRNSRVTPRCSASGRILYVYRRTR